MTAPSVPEAGGPPTPAAPPAPRATAGDAGWLALLAVLLACPFGEGGALPTPLLLLHTLVLAAAGFVLLGAWRAGEDVRPALPAGSGWIVAALGALAISAVRASYGFAAALVLFDAAAAAGVFVLAGVLCRTRGRLETLLAVVAASGLLQALLSLGQRAGIFGMGVGGAAGPASAEAARPAGTFLNPNHLAAFLAVSALAGLALVAAREGLRFTHRIGAAAAIAVILAGFLAPASRGALVGLGAGVVVFSMFAWRRLPRRVRLFAALALAAATVAALALLAVRFRGDDPYRWERVRLWRAALEEAAHQPLLGIGPGQFSVRGPAVSPPHDGMVVRYGKRLDQTHSDLLRAVVEGGLLGGGLCLAAVGFLLFGMRRALARAASSDTWLLRLGCVSGVVVLLAHALVENLSERPALALTGAALAGASVAWPPADASAGGRGVVRLRRREGAASWRSRFAAPIAAGSLLLAVHLAAVSGPWLGWRHERTATGLAASDPRAAQREIESAIRWNPFHPGYRGTRAGLIFQPGLDAAADAGRIGTALLDVETARRLNARDARWALQEARLWRAAFTGLFSERSVLERALGAYADAERLAPIDPFIPLERATLHAAVGQRDEAFAAMDRALLIEPNYLRARLVRSRLAEEAGQPARAQADLEEARRRRDTLAGYRPADDYERAVLSWDETAGPSPTGSATPVSRDARAIGVPPKASGS